MKPLNIMQVTFLNLVHKDIIVDALAKILLSTKKHTYTHINFYLGYKFGEIVIALKFKM